MDSASLGYARRVHTDPEIKARLVSLFLQNVQ
jgi:hypothetical protein